MFSPLPQATNIPVEYLAASFRNVTNSYKFYWLLAILEHIQRPPNQSIISIDQLLARMVAFVWYPTNYFRLSFGKQDQLSHIALQLGAQTHLPINAKRQQIESEALAHLNSDSDAGKQLKKLQRYVPYRFLSPFFTQQLRGIPDQKKNALIVSLAESTFHVHTVFPLYRFVPSPEESIEIHPRWFEYLVRHLEIVRGFCLWHLVNYVQKNNPNVPNVAAKLFEPEQRNLSRARTFWNLACQRISPLKCIYSGQPVQQNYSLDHFLPWRFVAHDLLWNLVPVPQNVNSAKGDSLPDLTTYFDPFARLQYEAFQAVSAGGTSRQAKLLEDYVLLFGASSISEVQSLPLKTFRQVLYDILAPQFQIARNMGFVTGWKYN